MTDRYRVAIVGGGVTGCAIAREFVRRGIDGVVLLERERDVGEGASKANSGILHTGFDAKPGTLEGRLLRRAAGLWPSTLEELAVPHLMIGALMLARAPDEAARLTSSIVRVAREWGVHVEVLDGAAARAEAPYVAEDTIAAVSIPDEGVVDPFWLTRAFAEAAMAGGAVVKLGTAVSELRPSDDDVVVRLDDGRALRVEQVIDAAGLHADEIARLAGHDGFTITPRKGQFLVSEEDFGIDRIVLPVPGPMGKGMLVTPIIFGGLLLGPTAFDGSDKGDRSTDAEGWERILDATRALVPALSEARPIRSFAGLRPVSSTGDFIIGPAGTTDRLWLACGIRSTGISASPAVAERVVDDVVTVRRWRTVDPWRLLVPPDLGLPATPGDVVCLCRGVSSGEIEAACRRGLAPTTLDGVKRRGGAMFGDCQGNLCIPLVSVGIAEATGRPVTSIEKGPSGSWIFAGPGTVGANPRPQGALAGDDETRADLVVVGGGRAGAAAAEAAAAAGSDVVVVDREAGWTATGLLQDDGGWTVEVQSADGTTRRSARAALLATGGYVEPREHRPADGPRLSGVMTADLIREAQRIGLRPGRRAVVVGTTRMARGLAATLQRDGWSVEIVDRMPDEVLGEGRLAAVRVGDRWSEADSLILADHQLPQAFLLRGLGLVDGRPGIPAPADRTGRLPLPGLWAAGCCVDPDLDHRHCAQQGAAVAARIVADLAAMPA